MGPDLNGAYGGSNGVGGLEATVRETDGLVTPVLNDFYGNVLATITNGTAAWNPIRVGGYGPVNGYQPPALRLTTKISKNNLLTHCAYVIYTVTTVTNNRKSWLMGPISPAAGGTLYQQIVDRLKREISEGRLAPGAPLPSFRLLAE